MLKAVILDLNGVFVKSEKYMSTRLQEDFGVPENEFVPILDKVLYKARQKDNKDSFALLKPYLRQFGLKFTKEEFWHYWFKHEHEVAEMLELTKELKANNLKVFILSNNFWERAEYYKNNFSFAKLKDVADKIYFSFETGFIKPDPKAWQNILDENSLNPEECVYFDNSPNNIKSAKALGIKSFLFENPEKTGLEINNLI